jgi:hypothetical protein
MRLSDSFLSSFLDGFSMAGLLGQRRPGAPTRLFAAEKIRPDQLEEAIKGEASKSQQIAFWRA